VGIGKVVKVKNIKKKNNMSLERKNTISGQSPEIAGRTFAIIGGGLVGALLAVVLAKKGFRVDVLERRDDIRINKLQGGRSINLALSYRGLKALELIGLSDAVKEMCIPMKGRAVHDTSGNVRIMSYGTEGQAINSISRDDLNRMLLSEADKSDHVKMYFGERCEYLDLNKNEIVLRNEHSNELQRKKYDIFFGTDGAFSAARLSLMKTDRFNFNYNQSYLDHGYKELHIPPGNNGTWLLEKNALHIWPRKSFMMIALPNMDGSFTCTLFFALKGAESFEKLNTEADVKTFFEKYFPDAIPLMPTLIQDFFNNPTSSLATIKCSPWHFEDRMTLLGDAAHAIVPFYGQGMNCGFEDCVELDRLMDKHPEEWKKIFEAFGKARKPNSDAIADLAVRNFVEMRDLVSDPDFILKNALDKTIGKLFPEQWTPLYTMVSFTDIPYADAQMMGEAHDKILDRIVQKEGREIGDKLQDQHIRNILQPYIK
jgi:kynurenine 3-monooxygenase